MDRGSNTLFAYCESVRKEYKGTPSHLPLERQFHLYCRQINRIKDTHILSGGFDRKYLLDTPISVEVRLPKGADESLRNQYRQRDESYIAIASLLRPLLMDGDCISFYKIHKRLSKAVADKNWHNANELDICKKAFSSVRSCPIPLFKYLYGTDKVTYSTCMEIWFYGSLFHIDPRDNSVLEVMEKDSSIFQFHRDVRMSILLYLHPLILLDSLVRDFLYGIGKPCTEEPRTSCAIELSLFAMQQVHVELQALQRLIDERKTTNDK